MRLKEATVYDLHYREVETFLWIKWKWLRRIFQWWTKKIEKRMVQPTIAVVFYQVPRHLMEGHTVVHMNGSMWKVLWRINNHAMFEYLKEVEWTPEEDKLFNLTGGRVAIMDIKKPTPDEEELPEREGL